MIDLSDAAAQAQAEAGGNPIIGKIKQARAQLDFALNTAHTCAANRNPDVTETAITEIIERFAACQKLMESAMEDLLHKQEFEKLSGQ